MPGDFPHKQVKFSGKFGITPRNLKCNKGAFMLLY